MEKHTSDGTTHIQYSKRIMTEESLQLIVAAGTYDGVIAGWDFNYRSTENDTAAKVDDTMTGIGDNQPNITTRTQPAKVRQDKFQISFATPVHGGSVRGMAIASATGKPGVVVSCGYDEVLKTHDLCKRLTSTGEIRTPSDLGTPVCVAYAPPHGTSTHCLAGFASGKLLIYKKRDWSVQHIMVGHEGGMAVLAVHPTGKMALSGGLKDGKLKLWDLTKGRLAFVTKVSTSFQSFNSVEWNLDGSMYGFSYGSHITVRDVASGADLLDVELPSKVHQICFIDGTEGTFVAAACNDGSLPVLSVSTDATHERSAIMAIEPVDGPVAGVERFKCIRQVKGYYVVTANSAGVVSLMNLQGAVNMIMQEAQRTREDTDESGDSDDSEKDDGGNELAVDIIDSVCLGSGARITCLSLWCFSKTDDNGDDAGRVKSSEEKGEIALKKKRKRTAPQDSNTHEKQNSSPPDVVADDTLAKARKLVAKAKKIQKRKETKRAKTLR